MLISNQSTTHSKTKKKQTHAEVNQRDRILLEILVVVARKQIVLFVERRAAYAAHHIRQEREPVLFYLFFIRPVRVLAKSKLVRKNKRVGCSPLTPSSDWVSSGALIGAGASPLGCSSCNKSLSALTGNWTLVNWGGTCTTSINKQRSRDNNNRSTHQLSFLTAS